MYSIDHYLCFQIYLFKFYRIDLYTLSRGFSIPTMSVGGEDDHQQYNYYARIATTYLERFERYDSQEILSYSMAHWMLSGDVYRLPTDPPQGMVSNINPKHDLAVVLFPVDESISPMCYR